MKSLTLLLLVAVLLLVGCAEVTGAAALGGNDPKVWVYIGSTSASQRGVYRCVDPEGEDEPVCTQVKVVPLEREPEAGPRGEIGKAFMNHGTDLGSLESGAPGLNGAPN